jgi:hypothetical protein
LQDENLFAEILKQNRNMPIRILQIPKIGIRNSQFAIRNLICKMQMTIREYREVPVVLLKTVQVLLPTADCRLTTADCRLPTADCRLPTADC